MPVSCEVRGGGEGSLHGTEYVDGAPRIPIVDVSLIGSRETDTVLLGRSTWQVSNIEPWFGRRRDKGYVESAAYEAWRRIEGVNLSSGWELLRREMPLKPPGHSAIIRKREGQQHFADFRNIKNRDTGNKTRADVTRTVITP